MQGEPFSLFRQPLRRFLPRCHCKQAGGACRRPYTQNRYCVPPLIRPLRDHLPPGEGYFPYRREVFGKSGTTPPQSWLVPRQLPLHREAFALPVMRLQCSKKPPHGQDFPTVRGFYVLIFPTIRPWDILPGRFFRPGPPPRRAYPPHRSRRTTGQRNGAPPPGPFPRKAAPPR